MKAKERAISLKFDSNYSLAQIYKTIDEEYPTDYKSETIRSWIRQSEQYKLEKATKNVIDIPETILKLAKRKTSKIDMIEHLDITERVLNAHISDLQEQSYLIDDVNGIIILQTKAVTSQAEHSHIIEGNVHTFALISDTHLCSTYQQITHLNTFYDLCVERGITEVYHCGDISDGYYKHRPSHIYELHKLGFDQQSNYIIENYPQRNGITTHFITGNHDNTHIMNGGSNIGFKIDSQRPDMNYLGMDYAKVWLTDKCDMDIYHPSDGSAYALSYKAQKRIDALQGGNKPKLMATGHYHKQFYMIYRNIHSITVPSFEAQTGFMRGKGLYADVGGCIITIKVNDDGEIKSIIPEFIPFYKMITDDY